MATTLIGVLCFVLAIPGAVHDSVQLHDRWRARGMKRPPVWPIVKVVGWVGLMVFATTVLVSTRKSKKELPSATSRATTHAPMSLPAIQPSPVMPLHQMPVKPQKPHSVQPLVTPSTSLPEIVKQAPVHQPTYQQQCVGSACAQGPNSKATFNQYGPRKLAISDTQLSAIGSALRPYAGSVVEVTATNATLDWEFYAGRLVDAMTAAGVKAFYHPMMSTATCGAPGVTLTWKSEKPPISDALKDVLKATVFVHEHQQGWIDPADLYVWVCPNQ